VSSKDNSRPILNKRENSNGGNVNSDLAKFETRESYEESDLNKIGRNTPAMLNSHGSVKRQPGQKSPIRSPKNAHRNPSVGMGDSDPVIFGNNTSFTKGKGQNSHGRINADPRRGSKHSKNSGPATLKQSLRISGSINSAKKVSNNPIPNSNLDSAELSYGLPMSLLDERKSLAKSTDKNKPGTGHSRNSKTRVSPKNQTQPNSKKSITKISTE
jgi:hypothetical protein